MSAIAKGVKKVFKGVKKVVKKIAKPVLIGGAIFFTAGIAAGGFAAFGASSGLSFFGAVGQTMAAGAQAVAGSLGIGSGIAGTGVTSAFAGTAAQGATLGTGVLAQTLGLSAGPAAAASGTAQAGAGVLKSGLAPALPGEVTKASLANLGGSAASGYAAGTGGSALATSGGVLGKVGGALKGMAGSNVGQLMLAQGIMGGIQSYAQSEEAKKDRKRFMKSGVFGVARGEKYGQAFGPADIEQAAASIPGTAAYARAQQQPQQGQTANATQPVQSPTPSGGGSLIGQTYEEGERQNQAQMAMQPGFSNPYNQNNQQGMPLLG